MTTQRGEDTDLGSEVITRSGEAPDAGGEVPVPRGAVPGDGRPDGHPDRPGRDPSDRDLSGRDLPDSGFFGPDRSGPGADAGVDGTDLPEEPDATRPGAPEGGRHQWSEDLAPGEKRADGFDPSDTGTWRVTEVVPGGESGRRTTTIVQYLLGLLAVDHVRKVTRWWFVLPVAGLLSLIFLPPWVGLALVVLGVLVLVARIVLVRRIAGASLARRYRPVEEDLRSAVEAGKANLRSELSRVGLPSGTWTLPAAVLRGDKSAARCRLREMEIHRILPEAQLSRALRVLDQAAPGR